MEIILLNVNRIFGLLTCLSLAVFSQPLLAEERVLRLGHSCTGSDPAFFSSSACFTLAADIYETLVVTGADGKIANGTIESWEWDFDASILSINLKKDRNWSDGTPVTVNDYVLSWRRILAFEEESNNPMRQVLKKIKGTDKCEIDDLENCASGISILDDYKMEITFDVVDPLFIMRNVNHSLAPIPAHFYELHGENWVNATNRPFNGFYKPVDERANIEELIISENFTLEINPFHPMQNENNIKKVNYAYKEFEKGAKVSAENIPRTNAPLDVYFGISIEDDKIEEYLIDQGWKVEAQNLLNLTTVLISKENIEDELFLAIKYILSAPELASRILDGQSVAVDRLFNHPDALKPFHNAFKETHAETREREIEKNLAAIGISQKNRREIHMVNYYDDVSHVLDKISIIFSKYGLDLTVHKIARADREQYIEDNLADLMFVIMTISLPDPSGFFLVHDWTKMATLSDADKESFMEMRTRSSKLTADERLALLKEAEEFVVNNGGYVPLYSSDKALIYRSDLCGIKGSQTHFFPTQWISWCK